LILSKSDDDNSSSYEISYLLNKLLNDFSDENCFEKVKSFLSLNNIQVENNVRYDER
jgi:hypothetical protein